MDKPLSVNRAPEKRSRIRSLLAGLGCAGVLLLLPSVGWAPQFTGGASVRVDPNVQVEFKWITDFAFFGKVEVFDNPDGLGTPVLTRRSENVAGDPIADTQHVVTVPVADPLVADTGYFFRVTATDPTNPNTVFMTPTPLPPLFTGTQAIGNVFVDADIDSAVISWEANVIGYGSVVYGTTSLDQGPVEDTFNITDHAIELTGLSAGTTYQFKVSNKHAIDRNSLAEATGQFTTAAPPVDVVLTQPRAQPRVIRPNDLSTLSVRTLHQGQPVAGVLVWFAIDPASSGSGTFEGSSGAQATSDANGVASVQMSATGSGLVHVNVTSATALNSLTMPVVVR